MAHRYGISPGGTLVAGAWEETDALSNSGEQLKLSFGASAGIRDFIYDDKGQWPDGADGTGYSLVLANPGTLPDPVNPLHWRLNTQSGGTLGQSGRIGYAAWSAPFGSPSAAADSYGERAVNLMEYTLGSLPNSATFFGSMAADVELVGDIAYGQITFVRNAGADNAVVVPQWHNPTRKLEPACDQLPARRRHAAAGWDGKRNLPQQSAALPAPRRLLPPKNQFRPLICQERAERKALSSSSTRASLGWCRVSATV